MIGFSLALVVIFGAITLLGFELWRRNRLVWNELFETIPRDGGLPAAFVKSYSLRFLADANSSKIVIPNIS